eukprot:jgi/Antlo1/63/1256
MHVASGSRLENICIFFIRDKKLYLVRSTDAFFSNTV